MSRFSDEMIGTVTYLGFLIDLANLNSNLSQEDKQDLMGEVDGRTEELAMRIKAHLDRQDAKIDRIIAALGIEHEKGGEAYEHHDRRNVL